MLSRIPRLRYARHLLLLSIALVAISPAQGKHPLKLLPISFSTEQADHLSFLDTASLFRPLDEVEAQPEIISFQPTHQTLVKDFDLDSFLSFSFRPEPNRNITDYTPVIRCHFPQVLDISDVHLAPPLLMPDGRANYTATLSFERAVGTASLDISFQRPDKTVYTTVSFEYTICGISFYHINNGKRNLLPDNLLSIHSFRTVVKHQIQSFYCFIQFPDGSTSKQYLSEFASLPALGTVKTDIHGGSIIPTHNFPSCKQLPHVQDGQVVLPDSCPFGFTSFAKNSEPYFAVRLLPYKTGAVTFRFAWPDFLTGFMSEEVYETSLTISVGGKLETSVVGISPDPPFRKTGGQLLRCTLINASPNDSYMLFLGEHKLEPFAIKLDGEYLVTTFVTPAGSGADIPWDVRVKREGTYTSCPWASEEARFVFSYAERDMLISSLKPSFGPAAGGVTVTCSGHFQDFSLKTGDRLIFGTYSLEEKNFISITENSIVFKLPPRGAVGTHAFEVLCYVIIKGLSSNKLKFAYESLSETRISIAGASYQAQNNTYMVPFCSKSVGNFSKASIDLFAQVNSAANLQYLEFRWLLIVLSTKQEVIDSSGGVEAQSFALSLERLSVQHVYKAFVIVRDNRFQTQRTSSILLQPTYSRKLGVGISIDPTRTLLDPPVDARMVASILDFGKCFGGTKRLTFEWTFLSKKSTLSYESEDVNRVAPSPRRLGREFIIPRRFLEYGEHEVQLKVLHTDNPDAFGTMIGKFNIEPAKLKAVIGAGESMLRVAAHSSLTMSGTNSFDRDSPSLKGQGLEYLWKCELSIEGGQQFRSSVGCPEDILQKDHAEREGFTITLPNLGIRKARNDSLFLRFSLQVKKTDSRSSNVRVSPSVSQIVEFAAPETNTGVVGEVAMFGPNGRPLDIDRVPYFDHVILSPQALEDYTWRFKLIEPAEEAVRFLENPDNLLHLPGFFRTNDMVSSRKALGIKRGAMTSNTKYTFQIDFWATASKQASSLQFTFKTMPSPQLRFVSISQTEGTTDTVFFATAISSVEDYSFKYYFYIRLRDGVEVCIDGCSGHRSVSFRVPVEGDHVVRCILVDARGKYILARAEKTHKVNVRSKPPTGDEIAKHSEVLFESLQLGDHSSFTLGCISLVFQAKTINPNRTEQSEKAGSLVSTTLEQLADLFRKSQTSTELSRDYMKITQLYASFPVGHEGLATEETFYHLCQMMFYAVQNTPREERLDLAADLNSTLSHLSKHARQLFSFGSSRQRLVQAAADRPADVNEKLLELSELIVPLWTNVRERDSICGDTAVDEVGGAARVSTGTYCTREHGLSMTGVFSRLSWCDDVFGKTGTKRTTIVLGEFRRDYISESGVLSLRRHAAKLPTVENGSVGLSTEEMASHGYGIVRTVFASDNALYPVKSGCLQLTQKVRPTRDLFRTFGAGVICDSAAGLEFINPKTLNEDLKSTAYSERALLSTNLNASDVLTRQQEVEITSEIKMNGRYGVKRKECRHVNANIFGVVNGRWIPIVSTICILILTLIMMIGGVKIKESGAINATVEAGSNAYIERDVYGRDANHVEDEQRETNQGREDSTSAGPDDKAVAEGGVGGEEVVFERKGSAGGGG